MTTETDFIESYRNSDTDLYWICQDFKKREDLTPFLKATIHLRESLAVDGNKEFAQNLASHTEPETSTNNDLIILKKALQANVAYASKNFTESQIHIKEGKSYFTKNTLEEIKAYINWIEITIDINNLSSQKNRLKELLQSLNFSTPRINQYKLINLINNSILGASKTKLEELLQNAKSDRHKQTIQRFLFIDAMEAGNIPEATNHYQVFSKMKFYFAEDKSLNISFEKFALLLDFYIKAQSNDTQSFVPVGFQAKSIERTGTDNYPTWLLTAKSLLEDKPQEALYWARLEQRSPYRHRNPGFFQLNILRAELSNRNIETAENELRSQSASLKESPILPFFQARLALLQNSQKEAENHLINLGKLLEQHNAWGRLEIELLLANELKPIEIFNMGRSINNPRTQISETSQITLQPIANKPITPLEKIIGISMPVKLLKSEINKAKNLDLTVLITGETGTGKELIAESIHECSHRKEQPFLKINCAAVSESLLESELFGHEKGAFTGAHNDRKGLFEEAGKGTVFLDEIGEISPKIQTALLRVLEANEIKPLGSNIIKKIQCRVITATNADLSELAKQQKFRQDLYFRLHRLPIQSPTLRDRKDDILLLANHFANEAAHNQNPPEFSSDLKNTLINYRWPGNIRELKNEIERMVLMNLQKKNLGVEDLDINIQLSRSKPATQINHPARQNTANQTTSNSQPAETNKKITFDSALRRMDFIKQLFVDKRNLTRQEIAKTTGVSTFTISRDLKQLIQENFIEKITPTAAPRTHYFQLKTMP